MSDDQLNPTARIRVVGFALLFAWASNQLKYLGNASNHRLLYLVLSEEDDNGEKAPAHQKAEDEEAI